MTNLSELLISREPTVGKSVFIAVDGRGGSGKSTLAQWLSEKLMAQVVRTDDFASWDNPLNWWPELIVHVFEPIKNGERTISYPRSKWWENHYPEPVIRQPVTETMILEGVSSARREFRPYVSVSIFVDTPKAICLRRGIERDRISGKPESELMKMWEEWFEQEDVYLTRDEPKLHADIVIDGTKPLDIQITI